MNHVAGCVVAGGIALTAVRQLAKPGFKIMNRQAYLLDVVGALHASSCFTSGLYCWEEQSNQDANDGNDNQQLYQRESAASWARRTRKDQKRFFHFQGTS